MANKELAGYPIENTDSGYFIDMSHGKIKPELNRAKNIK
jgi:hypothetical protein